MLPASYDESRRQFRILADAAGAVTRAWPLPDQGDGTSLSTDTALLGSKNAQTLVMVASGTHGVEGYAGAACQFRFLQAFPEKYAGANLAFLLVHAVNPWGFAHDRRTTQEGIDLNRNFIDFSGDMPDSEYGRYHALLVEDYRPLPRGLRNRLRLWSHIISAAKRRRLQAAVTSGQFHQANGLFFGGAGPASSRLVWESIVADAADRYERLVLLDIHTGLGRRGHGELMSHLTSSAPGFSRISQWFAGEVRSMVDGQSVSPALKGMLTAAFVDASPARRDAIGLEFGTRSPLAVLNALRADQWTWNHRQTVSLLQHGRARTAMRRAFAPCDAAWHQRIIQRYDQVIQRLVAGALTL